MQELVLLLAPAVICSCSATESETRIDYLGTLKRDLFRVSCNFQSKLKYMFSISIASYYVPVYVLNYFFKPAIWIAIIRWVSPGKNKYI